MDVKPLVEGIEDMLHFYFTRNIDALKIAVSLPGISRHMLFDTARKQNESFASILGKDEDLYYVIKRNIVGGPSIIFHREHGAGQTLLYDEEGNVCVIILGYDANSLYLWGLDQEMPCGGYIRRMGPDFKPEYRLYNREMYDWMDFEAMTENITIWHARNHGEQRVGKYKLDGYCKETNTAYEFDGCYYHGCDICYKNKVDPDNQGSKSKLEILQERRKATEDKRAYVESKNINYVSIRECRYKEMVKISRKDPQRFSRGDPTKSNLYSFVESRLPSFYRKFRYGPTDESTIMWGLCNRFFFGMLEVDIEVPDHLHEKFAEMSPLFHTVDIPFEDIGEHMQKYVKDNLLSQQPRNLLVGGMKAEKILLHSELLLWYLRHGLEVTKIHQVVEFRPRRVFRPFVEKITEARRAGDVHPDMKPVADAWKMIGNCAYGSLILDKEKHQSTRYVTDEGQAQQLINNARFKTIGEVNDNMFEVTMSKARILCDLPIQLGFTILQLAKLRMLQFYYDFLQAACIPKRFQMTEMDTDAFYMALAGPDFESIMKNDAIRERFHNALRVDNCNDSEYGPDQGHMLPRECCAKHSAYDARTPGLFKLEATGTEMISLCSKTYSLKTTDGGCKFSSKGLNKNALSDPHATYKQVLETGIAASGRNRGIKTQNHAVITYEQDRQAINYFYCKRQVMDDGRSTRPLPTILKPWPDKKFDVVENEKHPLWPHTVRNFEIDGHTYETLEKVCTQAMKLDDPDELVMKALVQLPAYSPVGELIFVLGGEFTRRKYKETNCYFWTSGMESRAVRLVEESRRPGLNRLAELWNLRMTSNTV